MAAAGWDLARRRIPNPITAATAVAGLAVQGIDRGLGAALSGAGAGALAVALLYGPWMAGGIGGGDVKLAGAAAVWVGLSRMIWYGLAVAVAGGVVAIASYALSRRSARAEIRANLALAAAQRELPPVTKSTPGRVAVPYGVAIAAGAVVALLT